VFRISPHLYILSANFPLLSFPFLRFPSEFPSSARNQGFCRLSEALPDLALDVPAAAARWESLVRAARGHGLLREKDGWGWVDAVTADDE
jgi:hypothetical protein